MNEKFDLMAPYTMPNGTRIYGAAAANRRIADAGGFNPFSFSLVEMGAKLGYQNAVNNFRQSRKRG